jgi:hypothetical protein
MKQWRKPENENLMRLSFTRGVSGAYCLIYLMSVKCTERQLTNQKEVVKHKDSAFFRLNRAVNYTSNIGKIKRGFRFFY